MVVMKDPVTKVIRERTKYRMKQGWAVPVLGGDFIPGEKKPRMFWGDAELLSDMAYHAMNESPELKRLGILPQTLATGLELTEDEPTEALADSDSVPEVIRKLEAAIRRADDKQVSELAAVVQEARKLSADGLLDGKGDANRLTQFGDSVTGRLSESLTRFNHLLTPDSEPAVLVREVLRFDALFTQAGAKPTRDALLAAAPAARAAALNRIGERAKAIRTIFKPVEDTFAAALLYTLNAGFSGAYGLCHLPRTMAPAKAAAFLFDELIERKECCYDVVLLNPLADPSILTTHYAGYFSGEELVQATVFGAVDYDTADDLAALLKGSHTQAGSAAGHFCLVAGFGHLLGRRVPIHAAVAARRRKLDELLFPRGGQYGLLESSFGCQDDKALYGLENVDLLGLRDGTRARYSEKGVNTPALTKGVLHLFRARSMSSDVAFSQYDAVRAQNWLLGTLRQFLRTVTVGQCNDSVLKARVAKEGTELLMAPFEGKADFEVVVTPGKSTDPREFQVTLTLPHLAYVETITIFAALAPEKK
jgi:hypothetical protein